MDEDVLKQYLNELEILMLRHVENIQVIKKFRDNCETDNERKRFNDQLVDLGLIRQDIADRIIRLRLSFAFDKLVSKLTDADFDKLVSKLTGGD